MKKVKGKKVYYSFYDTVESVWMPIACATSNTITENQDTVESEPNKCEDATSFSYGNYSYELSVEGLFLDPNDPDADGKASHKWLRAKMKADRTADVNTKWRETIVYPDDETEYKYGEGIITSLELTGDAEGDATFSLSLQGIGEILDADPTTTTTTTV